MSLSHFEIEVGPAGHGVIKIDGEDVSNSVRGWQLTSRPQEVTVLVLEQMGGASVVGDAEVVYAVPPEDIINHFLSMVNPKDLETRVMEGLDWDDGNVVQKTLEVLRELANASKS